MQLTTRDPFSIMEYPVFFLYHFCSISSSSSSCFFFFFMFSFSCGLACSSTSSFFFLFLFLLLSSFSSSFFFFFFLFLLSLLLLWAQSNFPVLGRNQLEVTGLFPQCRGFVVQYRHGGRVYQGFCVEQEDASTGNRPYFSADLVGHRVEDAKPKRRGKEMDKFVCTTHGCGEQFQSRAYLNWHRRLVHNEATPSTDVPADLLCPLPDCRLPCDSVTAMMQHLAAAHAPPKADEPMATDAASDTPPAEGATDEPASATPPAADGATAADATAEAAADGPAPMDTDDAPGNPSPAAAATDNSTAVAQEA